ncbi:hypothetical protein CPJCM30710_23970 [Clostridium polyendosporum]|uniref:Uncharacterized protein n=1 Tax=Clostridium polyendosporum TaxID=69208 RepID=A0A919VHJ0_9CLOT|nr:hypothetical protein [Clostridium polyendosporum]GIM29731.1 hypothetical protein CPJCM30710_23970 [Clostridium polyendosporum]
MEKEFLQEIASEAKSYEECIKMLNEYANRYQLINEGKIVVTESYPSINELSFDGVNLTKFSVFVYLKEPEKVG